MTKINKLKLKKGLFGMTALILGFGPFVAVNGDDGIFGGTITTGLEPLSAGQQSVFTAMGNLCTSFGAGSLACDINDNIIGPPPPAGNFLPAQQLSPQSAMQAETVSITSPYKFIRSVNQQAQKLIDCDKQKTKEGKIECKGAGASSDVYGFIGPFGISISGGGGLGDQDTVDGQTGFELDTRQANLMIDYSFNQKLIGGFSFGYLNTERNLDLNSGGLDSNSYRFAPFLLFRPTSNSYLTIMGGYALVNYDSTRKVSPFSGTSGVITVSNATAEYDADQYFASLGGGYTFSFMDGWSLRGYGRGDYSNTDIESFQENGGISSFNSINSYAMRVEGQSINSITTTIGAELSYAISTPTLAAVIIPKLRAEWVHEYKNSGGTTRASFNKNSGIAPTSLGPIAVAGPERNWANLGAGLQMLFPHAIVGYVNYDALIIDNASNHTITGGIRVNF